MRILRFLILSFFVPKKKVESFGFSFLLKLRRTKKVKIRSTQKSVEMPECCLFFCLFCFEEEEEVR